MAWNLEGLLRAAAVSGETRGDTEITGLQHDHRRVAAGDLFCCIPGAVTDGHDRAPAAIAAGAVALLVERFLEIDRPQAKVERVRSVLGPLADTFYGSPSSHLQVAGVTGTNGKTTVTYLLESIYSAAGMRPGVVGSVSRRFAGATEPAPRNLPEASDLQELLARMRDAGVDVVALEATSEGLVQGRLDGTKMATAGFTNLTQDHLNTHGTMDAYFDAKAMLFDPRFTQRAVINVEDRFGRTLFERVSSTLDVMTYGEGARDIVRKDVSFSLDGIRATLQTPAGPLELTTELVGGYNLANCECAIGMAIHTGCDLVAIAEGLARPRVPGRLERVDAGQPFLAVVDYAHTPDALEKALQACRGLTAGRVIVVFGCGGDRDRAKRPLMGEIATRLADLTFVTSDNPRSEDPVAIVSEVEAGAARGGGEFRTIVDRTEAIAAALDAADDGDVVLVAGKGHEQGQQFADHTVPYDDREVVRELIEASCRR